jgi:hypothetical protein
MGGYSGGYSNGAGAVTSNSAPWMQMIASPGLPAGYQQMSRVILNTYIVLPGNYGGYDNDVWRSMDDGTTWKQVTVSPGWSARAGQSSVVMPDGSIVLMGGYGSGQVNNDVWKSVDNGATWKQVTVSPGWSARAGQSSVVMPDGSIILMGGWGQYGDYKNDVWRSTDDGATWKQVTVSPGWSARAGQSSVVMPDGSTILMGGWSGQENGDVWRLMAAGSSEQDLSHTYTTPGLFQVTLEATNANGSTTRIQSNYITVSASWRTGKIPPIRYGASPGSGPVPASA